EYFYNNTVPIYFVVVGLYIDISSAASNIVEVRPEMFEVPPTPTPTPTTQETTEPTTEGETQDSTTEGYTTDDPAISNPTDQTSSTIDSTTDESSGTDPSNTTEDPEDSTSKTTEDPGNGNTTPPTSTEPELEESNKPWVKTTGGILTIIAIVFVCLATAGAGYWYVNKRRVGGSRRNLFGSSEA
ncbi:unnamed protein product, partial [Allacma fusca]